MSKKNNQTDYNLKDYTWEEEDFNFNPKPNRHKKFLHAKKRQLQKEYYADTKDKVIQMDNEVLRDKRNEADRLIAYEDYDIEDDEQFVRYRIK